MKSIFDFSLSDYMQSIKNSFSTCLPESAEARFKEIFSITFNSLISVDIINEYFKNPSSTEIDHLVDSSVTNYD